MDNVGRSFATCPSHLPQDVVSNVGEFRPSARPRHPAHRGKSPSALFKQIFLRRPMTGPTTGTRSLSPRRRKVVTLCGRGGGGVATHRFDHPFNLRFINTRLTSQDLQKEFQRCRDADEKRLDLSSSDVSVLMIQNKLYV
jgi:hypothetical protein